MRETLRVRKERAVLVGAIQDSDTIQDNLEELTALAQSAGAVIVDRFQQKIHTINPATYIGKGKAVELASRVKRFKADVVIFDNDLSPNQIRELESIIKAKVLDRSELILDIFATRAKTHQARLQVELAQLEYTYPRLTRMWTHLDAVAGAGGATGAGAVGGIGTRGPGEQQLEIDRRLVQKRISELRQELHKIDRRKIREIGGRKKMFKICLVGYTNAGKSTLLNKLTGAHALVEDRLFATLDTRTRRWKLNGAQQVLLSDTVGFVRNLPHQLVASFKATLEEAINADLLIHVVDASNSEALHQIESVKRVLEEIGCHGKTILHVFNKIDAIRQINSLETLQTIIPESICVSARTGLGLDTLTQRVLEHYHGNEICIHVRSSLSDGRTQHFLKAHGTIVDQQYNENHVLSKVRLGSNQLPDLERLKPEHIEILASE